MKLTQEINCTILNCKSIFDPSKNIVSVPLDVTHSNIQDFGVGFSVSETIRNVFNGAETLELAAVGNGSSKI
jgi:hypothetical protein